MLPVTPMTPRWTSYLWSRGNAWLGFAHRFTWSAPGRPSTSVFYIAWGRVGTLLTFLAFAGWLALATATWAYLVRARGYDGIAWTDVAFPWRWDERRQMQGRLLLGQVDALFAEGRYRDGLFQLRTGLRLVPDDLEARRKLAAIHARLGRDDLALETLAEGFPFARRDPGYAALVLELCTVAEEFERLLALAEVWLALDGRDPAGDPAARRAQAQALAFLGDLDAASAALREAGELDTPFGRGLVAQATWSAGRRTEALELVREAVALHPDDDALLRLLTHVADRLGQPALAESALRAREAAQPTDHLPALDLLGWLADRGDEVAFQRDFARILPRALPSERALADLVRLLARLGRVAEIDRVLARHTPTEPAAPVFALARLDGLLVARRIPEARAALEAWRARWADSLPHHDVDLRVAGALADAASGLGVEADAAIQRFVDDEQLGPRGLLTVARRFAALGLQAQALRILRHATELAPADPAVWRAAAMLAVDAGDWELLGIAADRLLARRRADVATLEDLAARLGSDYLHFAPGRSVLLDRLRARLETRPL